MGFRVVYKHGNDAHPDSLFGLGAYRAVVATLEHARENLWLECLDSGGQNWPRITIEACRARCNDAEVGEVIVFGLYLHKIEKV